MICTSVALTVLVVGSSAPAKAGTDRSLLTIEGQVTDSLGVGMADVWVYTKGSRRLSAHTDEQGRYSLSIPGATLREMVRSPFELWLNARLRSWNLAYAGGSTRLGIEMFIEPDSLGGLELQILSNDEGVARAIAEASVLDANPRVALAADFKAMPGDQANDRDEVLAPMERIKLGGLSIDDVDPATGRRLAREREQAAREAFVLEEKQKKAEAEAAKIEAAKAEAAKAEAAKAAKADDEQAEALAAKTGAEDATATGTEVETEAAAQPRARDTKTVKIAEAFVEPKHATERPARKQDERVKKSKREKAPDPRVDTAPIAVDAEAQAPPIKGAPRAASVPAAAATSGAESRVLVPKSGRWNRWDQSAPRCSCDVWGTIETDRPLSRGMKVTVWLEDFPEVTDTVDLYMGSPRAFHLGSMPCGTHRVRFSTSSKRRYELAPKQETLECEEGYMHVRLMLREQGGLR